MSIVEQFFKILRKGTISAQFRAIRPKLCRNYVFLQNFNTKKPGEIAVFLAEGGITYGYYCYLHHYYQTYITLAKPNDLPQKVKLKSSDSIYKYTVANKS